MDRFWVGDGGNWSDNANHWSATDGGAPNASKPTSADNVFFTANSFTTGSQTVTIDETASCLGFDWTGTTDSPILAFGANRIEIYDDITFIAAMSTTGGLSGGDGLRPLGSNDITVTSNGLSLSCRFTNLGGQYTGTLILADDLDVSGSFQLTSGNLTTNGNNITSTVLALGGAADTQVFTLGNSTITCTLFSISGTNKTFNANTSTIKISGTGAFTGGGYTYNNVELNGSAHIISGDNTFNTLTLKADTTQTITFTDGSVQTITTPVMTGSVGKVKTLQGSDVTGWSIVKAGGGTVIADYLALSYSQASPTDTWYHGDNCTIGAGVTGWFPIIKTPVADGDLIGIAVIRKS